MTHNSTWKVALFCNPILVVAVPHPIVAKFSRKKKTWSIKYEVIVKRRFCKVPVEVFMGGKLDRLMGRSV